MKTNRSIIKVFLASPGDLVEERRAAKRIVDEENQNHANSLGYQIELVGWEDTVAQHGRAQETINRGLDQCDYFVGMIWKRWGTPPGPLGTPYTSGFQEEYERSQTRFEKTGKPSISILFKELKDEDKRDVGPQLEQVIKFKKQFTEEYKGAYRTFAEPRDFEQRFRSIIALFVRGEIEEDSSFPSEEKSRSSYSNDPQKVNSPHAEDCIFEISSRDFVTDIISRKQNDTEFEYSSTEAARFRLLANSLQLSQNDQEALGVHDANLLYRDMRSGVLSKRETLGLLRAGLAYYTSSTAPLWHWLFSQSHPPVEELAFSTLEGKDFVRKNVFRVLRDFGDNLQTLQGSISRSRFY